MVDSPNLLNPTHKWWEEEPLQKPKNQGLRLIVVLVAVVLFLGSATLAGYNVFVKVQAAEEAFGPPTTFIAKVQQFLESDSRRLKGEHDDRINILLLGMGGAGHSGPYLTDTIIVLSLKPSTRQIALTSIPRDLLVNIPDHGWRKINEANSLGETTTPGGGPYKAAEVIMDTFGQAVPYVVRVDFNGFKTLINLMGGIDVDVPRSFVDEAFPRYEADATQGSSTPAFRVVSFEKGRQHMDGATALDFVRSRHGSNNEGSDFARGRRQQKVLLAVKDKMLSAGTLLNPVRIGGAVETMRQYVQTNMSVTDALRMARYAKDFADVPIRQLALHDGPGGLLTSGHYGGSFVLQPTSGNFDEIRTAFAKIFVEGDNATTGGAVIKNDPHEDAAVLEIQNGTWRPGLAAEVQKRVIEITPAKTLIGNSIKRPIEATVIYDTTTGKYPVLASKLSELLHAPTVTIAPPWFANATSSPMQTATNILILLGTDYLN